MRENVPFWNLEIDSFKMGATESMGYTMKSEHAHHHYEIMFNFSRIPFRHMVNGHVSESDTPYILYRAPYTLHSSSSLSSEKYRRYLLAFQPEILTEYSGICDLGKLKGQASCLIPTDENQMAMLEPLLVRLWWAHCDKSIPRRAWIGTLAALLCEINALVPDDLPPAETAPQYIQDLLYYIIENTYENLSSDALAEKFFVSRSKLLRDFYTATQTPLHEYITAIRVSRAKYWLSEGMSISMVSQRCGFTHESAFIYMFRRETGMTPGEYRKNLEQNE